ncbi:MAG: polysaccharide biosynthesis tyrosine autokinase [Candidatus Competibacteraceae bacterium]|nr:polysaccharide biosynthesis tyrosine autokinase [Candidatus Competibacteraceae bacterium]
MVDLPDAPASERTTPPVPAQRASFDALDEEIDLGEYLAILLEYKWFLLAVILIAGLGGGLYAFLATPIYKADALLQVEQNFGGGLTALAALKPMLEGDEADPVTTELELLQSRMVLGQVVDRLKLDLYAEPMYVPLIGAAIARHYTGEGVSLPWLGAETYAWGGEEITLDALDTPPALLGEDLTLVAGEAGRFTLFDPDEQRLLEGQVGERATGGGVSLFISRLKARPGTHFILRRDSRITAIDELLEQLSAQERTRGSSIIEISLLGPQPAQLTQILDEILQTYVRQNVERRSAQSENTLAFLETQLPLLKDQLDTAEAAYNTYRLQEGSVDLTSETQSVLKSIVEFDAEILKLQQERDDLRQRYTPAHPLLKALDAKLGRLRTGREKLDAQVSKLPITQQHILGLARDVEVNTRLYAGLLTTAQELRVARAGTVGNVRIVDVAVALDEPVKPRKALVLAVALLLGLVVGLGLVFLRRQLQVTVDDPDQIEHRLGLPVYASIPHSKREVAIARVLKRHRGDEGQLLAIVDPEDDAVESLRSLRTTLHFALMDADNGALLITGSSPGLGKSFISKNLAVVLAQSGKKVAIVDADLRKGLLHQGFGLSREQGVSEYVSGVARLEEILKATVLPNLMAITTGQRPPNPSELLMHLRFEELLQQLNKLFDIVIVDAPPVLAVTDAAIVGRMTGATLLVARAGNHPMRELEQTIKRLAQAGVQVKGFVFNDLDVNRLRYRYGYKGYVYRYSYKKS